ncbi:hypothetical protein HYN51_13150 [Limnobaculum parvum]|uniref:Uncharacterized protein n=1 Tax=Limnobaculum parvum TaxID=2172103 RepID=A0A2Y9U099_9GAMM|nr:hypothetical protein HYN51_13150 [Limnobaculum parvum]
MEQRPSWWVNFKMGGWFANIWGWECWGIVLVFGGCVDEELIEVQSNSQLRAGSVHSPIFRTVSY